VPVTRHTATGASARLAGRPDRLDPKRLRVALDPIVKAQWPISQIRLHSAAAASPTIITPGVISGPGPSLGPCLPTGACPGPGSARARQSRMVVLS